MKSRLIQIAALFSLACAWGCGSYQPPLQITTSDIPVLHDGVPFKYQMQASGGSGRYHWTTENKLPPGIELEDNGLLHGTPINTGKEAVEWRITFVVSSY